MYGGNHVRCRIRPILHSRGDLGIQDPQDHDRQFVGRIGSFIPVKAGANGGIMVKEMKDKEGNPKYDSVTGSQRKDKTPYRWLEYETIKEQNLQNQIDQQYYIDLCNSAIEHIEQFGDFYAFIS